MSSKNGKVALFLLGAAALVSAVAVAGYFFFGNSSGEREERLEEVSSSSSDEEDVDASGKKSAGGKKSTGSKKGGKKKAKKSEDDVLSPRARVKKDKEAKDAAKGSDHQDTPVLAKQVSAEDLSANNNDDAQGVGADTNTDNSSSSSQTQPSSPSRKVAEATSGPVVSDATNSDSDDEEKDDLAALKEQYDSATSVAAKLLQGNRFDKSAEKYTEAIDLAKKLKYPPSKTVVLYNNRSAMYERINEFEKSIEDIEFVLTVDPKHIKARNRRARIYEQIGKTKEALDDFSFGCLLEQISGVQMTNMEKIEALKTSIANKKTEDLLPTIKNVKGRALPTSSYCQRYFEESLNFYRWKVKFSSYSALTSAIASAGAATSISHALNVDSLASQLTHVCHQIASGDIRSTLTGIRANAKLRELVEEVEGSVSALGVHAITHNKAKMVALYYYLLGASYFLSYNVDDAILALKTSIRFGSKFDEIILAAEAASETDAVVASPRTEELEDNEEKLAEQLDFNVIESKHTLAVILADENSDLKICEDEFEASISKLSSSPNKDSIESLLISIWIYATRPNIWVMKSADGSRRPDGLERALADIDRAIALTNVVGLELSKPDADMIKHMKSFALAKKCTLLLETKQNELAQSLSEADKQQVDDALEQLKSLNLNETSRLIFELDRALVDNKLEDALELVRINSSNPTFAQDIYCSLHFVLIKCQAVFAQFNNPMLTKDKVDAMLEDITEEYRKVLAQESHSVDIVGQYSQFLIMTGKFDVANEIITGALSHVRVKEELKLFLHMLEGVSTNINATNLFKKITGMP